MVNAGVPATTVSDDLTGALRRVASDAGFTAECRANGYTLDWRFGDDFAAYMLDDDEQFGQVIRPDGAFQP